MPCRKMLFHFLCHSAEDCKQSSLVLLELLQEWSVQIEFRVSEPMEVKECFFFPMLRDSFEQSGNRDRIGKICLHECAGLLLEVFFHPASCFHHGAAEVMLPFPAVQVPEYTRLIWLYHKRVESAGHGFCGLHRTSVLVQEDAGIIFSDRFQEIHKIPAIVEQRNRCELCEKFIGAANIQTDVTQVLRQVEYIQTVYGNTFFHMAAARTAASAFETDFGGWGDPDRIEEFIFHGNTFPFAPENAEVR